MPFDGSPTCRSLPSENTARADSLATSGPTLNEESEDTAISRIARNHLRTPERELTAETKEKFGSNPYPLRSDRSVTPTSDERTSSSKRPLTTQSIHGNTEKAPKRRAVGEFIGELEITLISEEFKRDLENDRNFHGHKVHVTDDLNLTGYTPYTTLPENLSVEGNVNLKDCNGLTSLPENLRVVGYMFLYRCTGLTSLPENLSVGGWLSLSECTGLTSLPENLSVRGWLKLWGCTELTSLPEKMCVDGDLHFDNCTGLTSLPEYLSPEKNLSLRGCTGLTFLPENLSVAGSLDLSVCTGLTSLPENLSVPENLNCRGCTGLTSLPENLRVGGWLNLRGCTGLSSLPENLSVEGALYLNGCTGLATLSEKLTVGGDLNFKDCTGLTSLPNWITTLGRTVDGVIRNVYLENTGLSDAVMDRLRRADAPGMQFHFSRRPGAVEHKFSTIEQGLHFWSQYFPEESEIEIPFIETLTERDMGFVCRYLARLTNTAEYKNLSTRSLLAQRVLSLFQAMSQDTELKEILLRVIEVGLESCDDRVASSFDQMELKARLYHAEERAIKGISEEELRDLARSLLMLKKVEEKAREHMNTLSWTDDIEVLLAFQIGLRERLALPLSTQNMIFRGCAQVTDEQIARAGDTIERETTEEEIQEELEGLDAWKIHLRRKEIKPYGELPEAERVPEDVNWQCFISYINFSEGDKGHPVLFAGRIFDYDSLAKSYIYDGKNPVTHYSMKWSEVELRRVQRPEKEVLTS